MVKEVVDRILIGQIRPAVVLFVLLTVVTGVAYPLAVTGIATIAFPEQSAGSLIVRDGKPIGSRLIGQAFDDPKYFWGRPSATAPFAYNAGASNGSNLGPLHAALNAAVEERVEKIKATELSERAQPPVDLVTSSGSGLDPHISPAAAYYQFGLVAQARGLDENQVRDLVSQHIEGRTFGVLGEPRVNVLLLNLDLDKQ